MFMVTTVSSAVVLNQRPASRMRPVTNVDAAHDADQLIKSLKVGRKGCLFGMCSNHWLSSEALCQCTLPGTCPMSLFYVDVFK
ncbi:hypothetical protein DPEC_G00221090 [Dallia pectoralis]|uniref:Uncharacterized protein n=1 Tax=Dallia pectoralis TaxID=75939 RepID=A0ACC2G492_DALPE|nr:hypothetical protein DPEC_G00221090 [Dallia pectoralis]